MAIRLINKRIINLISKFRTPYILAATLLTVIILTELAKIPEFSSKEPYSVELEEKNGIYDLADTTEMDNTVINLMPGQKYYPEIYLTPETVDNVTAKNIDEYGAQRNDFLSQRFIIKLPDNRSIYTLTFTLSGRHAIRVYVNGKIAGQTGILGTTKHDTEVWENNISIRSTPEDGKIDIIINSAQFYHSKRGATLAKLSIYQTEDSTDIYQGDRLKGLIIMGSLLSAASIQLGIYLFLSHTKITLYFSFACITMALRECLQSQAWTYFPIPGNLSFQMEYITMVLLTIFLSLYLSQYATNKLLQGFRYTAIIGSTVYGCFVIFGDSILYTSILRWYQALLVICIVPGIIGVFYTMKHPIREQVVALYGIAVFYAAAVTDIIMYSDIFGDRKNNIPISEVAMVIFVLAQTFSLFLMNNRVVTEAREAEQKISLEKNALEELERLKTEFLGNVSHELKTPLTVISCHAQMVAQVAKKQDVVNKEELIHKMSLISSEGERLSLMVGQIQAMTRLEEGRMVFDLAPCLLDEIIYSAVEVHYPLLNRNKNRLEIRISPSLPKVFADSVRISQVIINLISNATRFTSNGLITITAEEKELEVIVCVSDTGTGITKEQLPYIFERFNNRQKTGNGKATGTGLGLYICKYIIEEQNGSIWVCSEEKIGTKVYFTLPLYTP